jgi:hypothetical protein
VAHQQTRLTQYQENLVRLFEKFQHQDTHRHLFVLLPHPEARGTTFAVATWLAQQQQQGVALVHDSASARYKLSACLQRLTLKTCPLLWSQMSLHDCRPTQLSEIHDQWLVLYDRLDMNMVYDAERDYALQSHKSIWLLQSDARTPWHWHTTLRSPDRLICIVHGEKK